MGSIWIILIVLIIIFRNAKKNERKTPPVEHRNFEDFGDYKAFEEPKAKSRRQESSPERTNRMFTRPEKSSEQRFPVASPAKEQPKKDIGEKAQNIQDRRIAQHENAKKSRIHSNIHRDDDKDMDIQPADLMHTIRDLIVCGYPTEIKNQRDFTKEGEDFLNSLSGDSLFF